MLKTTTIEEPDKQFYDYVFNLEKEWRKSSTRFTDKELLKIFPEAKEVILEKIQEWEEERDRFSETIKKKLTLIKRQLSDEFSQWFWREWVKISDGAELLKAENQISRLKRLQSVASGRVLKGRLTDEQIQQAKTVPIESLISQQLKRSGDKLVGLCPLHNEKTASFFIYPQNTFYCFGCQLGGDVIELIVLLHGFNFSEAVRWLNRN